MKTVVVIGAGVVGLCVAHYAAERGFRVVVLDRGPRDADGCSFGNAGMIVPSHMVPLAAPGAVRLALKWMLNPRGPFYVKPRLSFDLFDWGVKFWRAANQDHVNRSAPVLRDLHLASRACYEELAAESGNEFGLVRRGLLMLCKTQAALDEESHAADFAKKLGVPADSLSAEQAAALEPGVRMDVAGAVHYPRDCHFQPAAFVRGLRDRLETRGATFHWNTPADRWRTAGGRIAAVRTPDNEIEGDEFVLAGGVWSPRLAREIQLKLPMQAGKGYSVTLNQPRQRPELCAIFTEARVAVTPMGQSLRFGGTMEIAGLDETINPTRVQGIVESVPKYYPEFAPEDFRDLPVWRGLRPCSPDGLPYVGRTAATPNLCIAAGHAMMGMSLGPITGKLVAQVLSNERPSIDLSLLRPDRYA